MVDLVQRRIRKERLKLLVLDGISILVVLIIMTVHILYLTPRLNPIVDDYPEDCGFIVYKQVHLRDYFSQKALRVAFSATMDGTRKAKFYDTEHSCWSVVTPYEQDLYRERIDAFVQRKVPLEGVRTPYIWSQRWSPEKLCPELSQLSTTQANKIKIIIHRKVQHDDEIGFQAEVQKIVGKAWGHIKAFGDLYAAHTNNLLDEIKAKFKGVNKIKPDLPILMD